MIVLAWVFFGVGVVSTFAFLGLYVVDVKPWRRRPGEDPRVKLVRRNYLAWSGVVSLLYLSSIIGIITLGSHPSTDLGRMILSGLIAALLVNQLVTYLRVREGK